MGGEGQGEGEGQAEEGEEDQKGVEQDEYRTGSQRSELVPGLFSNLYFFIPTVSMSILLSFVPSQVTVLTGFLSVRGWRDREQGWG